MGWGGGRFIIIIIIIITMIIFNCRGPGTPAPTLRSMDESRHILEHTARKIDNKTTSK